MAKKRFYPNKGHGKKKSNGKEPSSKVNSKEYKFRPHGKGDERQVVTYNKILEVILANIQKEYEYGADVVCALRELTPFDMKKVRPSRDYVEMEIIGDESAAENPKDDEDSKRVEEKTKLMEKLEREQQDNDLIYEKQVDQWVERKLIYETNMTKAYAYIFDTYCATSMQVAIKELPTFESHVRDKPIVLLEKIQILMHTPIRGVKPVLSNIAALKKLLNLRQKDNESLLDYLDRFKQERNIVTSHLGKNFLDVSVENTTEYRDASTPEKQSEIKKSAFDSFMAMIFMGGSNKAHYGKILEDFATQYSLGNDQYPGDLLGALDVMRQVKIKKKPNEVKGGKGKSTPKGNETTTNGTSFAQETMARCYACGSTEHRLNTCPKKGDIAKNKWYVNTNKMHSHVQSDQTVRKETVRIMDEDEASTSWCGVQIVSMLQKTATMKDMPTMRHDEKNVIVLDNGSTVSILKDKSLVYDRRIGEDVLELGTNAGTRMVNQTAVVPDYGKVNFHPDGIANIFALCDMIEKGWRIVFDSSVENAFVLTKGTKKIKFAANEEGLYVYKPSDDYLKRVHDLHHKFTGVAKPVLLDTMTKRIEGFTPRQIAKAKRARQLYHSLGAPNLVALKSILRQNIVQDCPVTIEDINLAERIFGKDVSTLKGKSTRPTSPQVIEDEIEIPRELKRNGNRKISLAFDIIFINGIPFLTGIDRTIKFRTCIVLKDRTGKELGTSLSKIVNVYASAGYRVKHLHCDGEFKGIIDEAKNLLPKVRINFANPEEHVPDIERANRTLQERVRVGYYRLPFKAIPKAMIRSLTMRATTNLNLFPAKNGISKYYSPFMIIMERNINYNRYCQFEFGQYVQATQVNNQQSNTNLPRTLDGIYLRPTNSFQGGHEILDLLSGRVVVRTKLIQVPITPSVIERVHQLAEKDGIKSLKFMNRKKEPMLLTDADADHITGVYTHQSDQSDEESSSESDNDYSSDEDSESDSSEEEELDEDELQDLLEDMKENNERLIDNGLHQQSVNAPEVAERVGENEGDNEAPEVTERVSENGGVNDNDEDNDSDDDDDRDEPQSILRRSERGRVPRRLMDLAQIDKSKTKRKHVNFLEVSHNIVASESNETLEYSKESAKVMAQVITQLRSGIKERGFSFAQQLMLKAGFKKWGSRGKDAAIEELDQLWKRNTFRPILVKELTPSERRKAQRVLMFLTEKRDKRIKARACYNGKPTRDWISREDATSPTAANESVLLTAAIDAKEGRDVMSADVPNAFVQTHMPDIKEGEDRVTLKLDGELVDLLLEMDPESFRGYIVYEKGRKVVYAVVLKAIYGMLVASLLWYKNFRKELERDSFKFNNYDPCVCNKIVAGKQHTVRFHVDDVLSSHVDPRVNDRFLEWLNEKYGSLKKVTSTRGKIHEYLGMTLDFTEVGSVKVRMEQYVEKMLENFPVKLTEKDTVRTPARNNLLEKGVGKLLDDGQKEIYHTNVAKALFLCKRARPDIQPTVSILATRVQSPNESDWGKLVHLFKYINGSRSLCLNLSVDNLKIVKWYIDASFGVHPDFKSQTGGNMFMGKGAIISESSKQKLNTRSSTEAEIVGVDDVITKVLWTQLFLEEQGYPLLKNIVYQDNKSSILLEKNGRISAGKRSRAINIRYFFVTDQVEKGKIMIEYCPTEQMVADFMTKPLQGAKFERFRNMILGM